ncbi:hypothetical protein A1O3_00561 [Capronia epimyces CBS 606.96]|uniref:Uncharacterized protein n=1 Tax=Capronia epimyces CBS 606.96 TaxID=1182542 RepID=W9YRY6_9EURO|nr:uncharacterized protein A1O3_00561 [Capronia epimyces CBS 606.96]EXJ92011.1 hypothetical protein A1O3_00561 [Capronia epimyces CBS 606.96]
MADLNNPERTSRSRRAVQNVPDNPEISALPRSASASELASASASTQSLSSYLATPPAFPRTLQEPSPRRLHSGPVKVRLISGSNLQETHVQAEQSSTAKPKHQAASTSQQKLHDLPLTPERKRTLSNSMPPPATPASASRPQPTPLTPVTPSPKMLPSMLPPATPVKAMRRLGLGGQNGEESASDSFSSPIVRGIPLSEMQAPFAPITNPEPEPEKFQVGQHVYLLDSRGNSVLCSDTISPAIMHMSQLCTAEPNSVGKYPNPHQFDAPNVFIIERRLRWISADGQPQAPGGAKIVYKLIPKEGNGRERMVPVRDLIVEVRFIPGDWAFYLRVDEEGNKTRLEALVQGSEVVQHKRTYTIHLAVAGTVVYRVQDEDLEEYTHTNFTGLQLG